MTSIVELGTLVLALLGAGALWAFLETADEFQEGDSLRIDEEILLALRNPNDLSDPIGPRWVEEMCRDLTALGGIAVLIGLTLFNFGLSWMQRRRRSALFLIAAVGSGLVISLLLKHGYDRPRPSLVPHGSHVYTQSFPSGHSMLAAVAYLTLGAIQARQLQGHYIRAYVIGSALLVTAGIGFSRVYLGVHWPTDVIAGWTAGAAWAIACWLIARKLALLDRLQIIQEDTAKPVVTDSTRSNR